MERALRYSPNIQLLSRSRIDTNSNPMIINTPMQILEYNSKLKTTNNYKSLYFQLLILRLTDFEL